MAKKARRAIEEAISGSAVNVTSASGEPTAVKDLFLTSMPMYSYRSNEIPVEAKVYATGLTPQTNMPNRNGPLATEMVFNPISRA